MDEPAQLGELDRLLREPLVQHGVTGFYGVFPDAWREAAGFPIHGLVSRGFLRKYAWTLDFESMIMTFVPVAESRETGAIS